MISIIRNPLHGTGYTYREFGDYRGIYEFDPTKEIWHVSIDAGSTTDLGDSVYPLADGVVVATEWSGFGNYVLVEHEINGVKFYSVYAHLGEEKGGGITVNPGDQVTTNTQLGILVAHQKSFDG